MVRTFKRGPQQTINVYINEEVAFVIFNSSLDQNCYSKEEYDTPQKLIDHFFDEDEEGGFMSMVSSDFKIAILTRDDIYDDIFHYKSYVEGTDDVILVIPNLTRAEVTEFLTLVWNDNKDGIDCL